MCQQKNLKIIALILALIVMFFPILSVIQTVNHKEVVHAEESVVSSYFFRAMLVMLGITAYMQGNMSSTFSIPEADLTTLKDQFAQTLEADATKKAAWMSAQTDYLAGGAAKTMGAAELAKIGINDIYDNFKTYLSSKFISNAQGTANMNNIIGAYDSNVVQSQYIKSFGNVEIYQYKNPTYINNLPSYMLNFGIYGSKQAYGSGYRYLNEGSIGVAPDNSSTTSLSKLYFYDKSLNTWSPCGIEFMSYYGQLYVYCFCSGAATQIQVNQLRDYAATLGIIITNIGSKTPAGNYITGNITNNDLINSTDTTRSIIPTIPWIGTDIPVGTVVTPAIVAPYAGTVPIDVPISVPIDPVDPVDPVDPPAPSDVLSATLAILAALIPISGILDNLDLGIDGLNDVIDTGNTAIQEGLDNIGTIVEPITSSIEKFFDPPSKDIDWDKLKNIEIFNKFPFSIPADLYFLLSMLAADPSAPGVSIDLDLSFIGAGVNTYSYDLSQFDNFAQVLRSFELLAFVFFLLYASKNMIWK